MVWQVKSHHLYTIYVPTEEDLTSLKAYILLESTPEGKIEDTMQIALHSDNQITAVFDAATVTGLSELKQYTLTFETRPEEINIRRNTTSTAWEDLAEFSSKKQYHPSQEWRRSHHRVPN
jgi:folate-binding Fe-S cluster repair protein YgfZ